MAAADERGYRRTPLDVFVVYAAGLLQGFTLISFPALSNVFIQDFGLTDADYGAIFLPQVLFTVIGAFASGGLASSLGLRRLLFASLIANGLCQLLLSMPGLLWPQAAFALIMTGTSLVGLAFGLLGAPINSYPPTLFPTRAVASVVAVHSFIGIGLALGPVAAGAFVEAGAWAGYPLALAVACTTLALLTTIGTLPSRHYLRLPVHGSGSIRSGPVRHPSRDRLFWMFVAVAVIYAFAEGTFSNWVVIYLIQARGESEGTATLALSMFWVAMVSGRLSISALVTRIGPERIWMILPILMTAAFLLVPFASGRLASVAAFTFAGVACSGFYPLTIALASAAFPHHVAWVSSMLIAALMIGVGAGTFAIGVLSGPLGFDILYRIAAMIPLGMLAIVIPLSRKAGKTTGEVATASSTTP